MSRTPNAIKRGEPRRKGAEPEAAVPNPSPARTRDAEATQKRILAAAKREFAMSGLAGARVDVIAEKAEANKRMIYHYFGGKEALFTRVLEDAYTDLYQAEQSLKLDHLEPVQALESLVRFTWNYYLDNPEFLTLVNSANLYKAMHLRDSRIIPVISQSRLKRLQSLLDRGEKAGVFRGGVDAMQLNITIAAIGYYYLTNRFTGSIIFNCDFMAPQSLKKRIEFNIETIHNMVCR
ncbi:TetR family transcriptional regulator [Gluconacetobacter liquefaciens]|uniref:TetR family transcriptional regulator n=1 Tax=Gluconacetobacter liquefaciens TaxID=89584 RepID=A0A370GBL2_GLULI|nr:TetR/AcrR family transcriptional regulator [Gluconacetobacter liquefaciens]MBB2185041.1 TetR/AcrR family transcriptional regulator [Gluconacetobacter liquefaciens]RDI40469.1 TetR family transcriptional regulator [Gluconacetobacter liquefaciens]GEB37401.1 TetR family transcriptional regulator [Gluconacetobacter liquefaciens]